MNLDELVLEIKSCRKCHELVRSRSQPVPGFGDSEAKVLFVGLAPGRKGADLTGVPFTKDDSGVLFQEMLIRICLSKEKDPRNENPILRKAYTTNIVKCNPKEWGKTGRAKNRNPTVKEIKNCRRFLENELRILDPKVIVPLGKESTKQICKELGADCPRPWRREMRVNDVVIFPMYHPAFIVRGGGEQKYTRQKYQKDFERLGGRLKNELAITL